MASHRIKSSSRFFIENPLENGMVFSTQDKNLIHQIKNVMRKKVGEEIILLNNTFYEYLARILVLQDKKIELHILDEHLNTHEPNIHIHLYQSLLKYKDRFEWCLQKATEVGISYFHPLICEHYAFVGKINEERLYAIAKEATEQSMRSIIPPIHPAQRFEEAFRKAEGVKIVCDDTGKSIQEIEILPTSDTRVYSIFIGPEGGWSEMERKIFTHSSSTRIISLGKTVLRSETAGIIACHSVLQRFGI